MFITLIIILALFPSVIIAQEATEEPEESVSIEVSIEAEDGATLAGEYFAPFEEGTPAVLLLHEMYTTRASWTPLIYPLLANGYRVLAVDLRGYGDSRRAGINWVKAQEDTQLWLEWLRSQPGVGPVFIVGSSMGANLALNGCVDCAGVVALSPGLNYYGVKTQDALTSGSQTLVIYAERDLQPRQDMPEIIEMTEELGTLEVITYEGRAHGKLLFDVDEELPQVIIDWLNRRR